MSKIMSVLEKLNVIEKFNDVVSQESGSINIAVVKSSSDNKTEEVSATNFNNSYDSKCQASAIIADAIKNKDVQAPLSYEKNMQVNEIYSMFDLANSNIDTVFMLGNFINALPENLPTDVKKNSVINILNASNTDLDSLLSDGDKRLAVLSQFANDYSSSITGTISEYKSEIVKLEKIIEDYKKKIKTNENMLVEQNHIIKYETQKISVILDFFRSVK